MKPIYILLILSLLVVGCTANQPVQNPTIPTVKDNTPSTPTQPEETKTVTTVISDIINPGYTGRVLAGEKTPYIEFNTQDYDKASREGKIIFLYFYSDFSSICKTDETKIIKAFNDMSNTEMIGFKVHYDDEAVTGAEKQLATILDVKDARTKIILKDGVIKQKSTTSWDINTYAAQMSLYLE
jgi:hypothetical protein